MTVRSGAAGNESAVLNSNICSSSTMKMKIWCCEYLSSMEMDTVCGQSNFRMDGWNPQWNRNALLQSSTNPREGGKAALSI